MLALLMMIEDEEERISFQILYENTYRKLIVVARGILHNEADAEEAVHDVYVKLAGNYKKYRDKTLGDMTRLCVIMTKNQCIDLIRKRKRHPEIPAELDDDLLGETGSGEKQEDILEGILLQENMDELILAIKTLGEEDRVLLLLRYDREFSYAQIAREMKLNVNTVKARLYRIKKKLRELMMEHESE